MTRDYPMVNASAVNSGASRDASVLTDRSPVDGTRGGVLMIVGPDGTGKTTLSNALAEHLRKQGPVRVLANRKGVESFALLPRRAPRGPTTMPHRDPPHPPLLSFAKVLYWLVDVHLAWLVKIRPSLTRGEWVIVERGWWDMAVDPLRYRLRVSPRLGRFLARLMPRPTLLVALEASPEGITARKAQLPIPELSRQMRAWHELVPPGQRRLYLDTSAPVEDLVRTVSRAIGNVEMPSARAVAGVAGPVRKGQAHA
jgi:thymidylate kinase